MRKTLCDIEMIDGRTFEGIRILAADKIRYEQISRMNGWQMEEGPRLHSALAFLAARREGLVEEENLDDFIANLADYALENPEEKEEETATPDPTSPLPEATPETY